ncbi:MAG: TylF/MycF/NovP-related O-methyltransferase [Mycobacteriales bacterium]
MASLSMIGMEGCLTGIYTADGEAADGLSTVAPKAMARLEHDSPDIVVVASDVEKEALIEAAAPHLRPSTRLLVGGYGHYEFRDPMFLEETQNALVPSLANGYPGSLIHIFQCLQNASRLGLNGAVAEFGMFRGGTTMLLSRFIERLGQSWKVYGFDTFSGFPPRRSVLDMYAHPDCVYLDEQAARRYLSERNVEIVSGDLVETADRMAGQPLILAFVDTDNYTPATKVLDVIQDNVLVGGAIVFDHFTGQNRFLYTLGERLAAKRLLDDPRYFNLHNTGVFLRQR